MLRSAVIIAVALVPAFAARAQEACDPDTFENTCVDATLTFCSSTESMTGTQDCTLPDPEGVEPDFSPNATCGTFPCANDQGDGCTAFELDGASCVATENDGCAGILYLLDEDATNDNFVYAQPCAPGLGCVVGDAERGETCETMAACTPDSPPVTCDGNTLIVCAYGISEDSDGSGAIDGTETDEDGDGAIDSLIVSQPLAIDCAATFEGGTCDNLAQDGPIHFAFGLQTGPGAELPDCLVPDTGEGEGEGEGEEGEGEGEGEGGEGEGERDDEEGDEDDPPSGGACGAYAQGGTPLAILAALGLVIRRRRR